MDEAERAQWLLRNAAREHVYHGTMMTVEQAHAWIARADGLCACVGGKACCVLVMKAARAVLAQEDGSDDLVG